MNSKTRSQFSRRDVLKAAGGGLALLPLAGLAGCSRDKPAPAAAQAPAQPNPAATAPEPAAPPASAAEAPAAKLAETDPAAAALGYRHDATQVDTAAYPRRAGDAGAAMFCHNCALYQGGEQPWGGCSIFPGKQVSADGWCNAWAPKG